MIGFQSGTTEDYTVIAGLFRGWEWGGDYSSTGPAFTARPCMTITRDARLTATVTRDARLSTTITRDGCDD